MISFGKPKVEQFFKTYNITNFTLTKDETKLLFTSNLNGSMAVWAVDPDRPFPYLFSDSGQAASFLKTDPENRYILAGFDNEGDENYHIYALPFEGGKAKKLIGGNEGKGKYFFAFLSEDGERVYYSTSEGNPQFLNSYVYSIPDASHTLIHEGEESPNYITAVSKDERYIIITKMFANTYKVGYIKDTSTGEAWALTETPEEEHEFSDAAFLSASQIVYVTNENSEFSYAVVYDFMKKEPVQTLKLEGESIEQIKWDEQNRMLYIVSAPGVEDRLYKWDFSENEPVRVDLPVDTIDQFTLSAEGSLYILGRSSTQPFNIFRQKKGTSWDVVTENRVMGINEDQMVSPEIVSYKSFDNKEIESLWFKAKKENDNGHVIFWPHGGPQAAERKMFRSMFQSFLNRGYSVFAPNFRGSTGYGATFKKLVEQDWGEGPRLDCVEGIEWLFKTGKCDRDKLFIVGGSYGGYMTLLLAGRHPDYFKAVVDIFGVSNLFTFINSVPDHWKPIMNRWVGDPEKDKDRLTKDSPITYLSSMTQPMLVIQGANDPRVVQEESDQIVNALREQGTAVDYLVLEDEGHGFSKKKNEINVYEKILAFLDKHK
ncbi:S9 family peptidase [Salipaludibacillus aurantiacus]|uniref:Dipeptidyl aminopeptidase/acylaminoacyl peptidase n=1 Tax=Salipaludibacillus aurantiacus TaxID=1601833 RepID=A0A1H9P118_9BACI|nr:S9 family peptidase [Salipaludibacillus aurantiacus]SER41926.1 Dipeptidyl aminopeptidase/acylaminoacyl peptidase [Salipaludibacillus aurantiacus]